MLSKGFCLRLKASLHHVSEILFSKPWSSGAFKLEFAWFWILLLSCPSSLNWVIYVWPGSCTVKSLLISSRQIFQAAFIFKKWASQQVLHGLLWGPEFTGYICCISRAAKLYLSFSVFSYPKISILLRKSVFFRAAITWQKKMYIFLYFHYRIVACIRRTRV